MTYSAAAISHGYSWSRVQVMHTIMPEGQNFDVHEVQ
jgi:hypothetical protein